MSFQGLTNAATISLATPTLAQQQLTSTPGPDGGKASAPEIDASLATAAVALLLGGLFLLTTARRRKLARS
jgi:hypothetical protein